MSKNFNHDRDGRIAGWLVNERLTCERCIPSAPDRDEDMPPVTMTEAGENAQCDNCGERLA